MACVTSGRIVNNKPTSSKKKTPENNRVLTLPKQAVRASGRGLVLVCLMIGSLACNKSKHLGDKLAKTHEFSL